MDSNLVNEEHQNFEHNIKKEPEVEFLCILPSYASKNNQEENLVHVKQENETEPEEITRFQCKICQKTFGTIGYMETHEKTHQKPQCKVCNRKIPPHSLEKHMKSHQNEKSERKFECEICFFKLFTKPQYLKHVLRHSKRFQCDLCGHFSTYKRNIMGHMILHFAQGQYKCIFCRKLFEDRESFRLHSRQVHGDPENRLGVTKADLSCGTCGKEFDDVQGRKRHEKRHGEKVQCSICDKKLKPGSLQKHLKTHKVNKNEKKFKCDICSYENAHKRNLKYHLETHLYPDKIKCKICSKKFANTKALKKHSRTVHNFNVEPSELCCNVCHVKCKNLSALHSHKLGHKYPKKCPVCSKSITPKCFPDHMKMHELKKREKKIECKICEKKFYIKKNLHSHMKNHS